MKNKTLTQTIKDVVDFNTKEQGTCLQTIEVLKLINSLEGFENTKHSSVYSALKSLEKKKLVVCGYLGLGSSKNEGVTWWSNESIRFYYVAIRAYLENKQRGIKLLIKLNKENDNLEIDYETAEKFFEKRFSSPAFSNEAKEMSKYKYVVDYLVNKKQDRN